MALQVASQASGGVTGAFVVAVVGATGRRSEPDSGGGADERPDAQAASRSTVNGAARRIGPDGTPGDPGRGARAKIPSLSSSERRVADAVLTESGRSSGVSPGKVFAFPTHVRFPSAILGLGVLAVTSASGPARAEPGRASKTRCRSVLHIGDSLAAEARQSLSEAYRALGVTPKIDAYAGRSALQKLRADPMTGRQAARRLREHGFTGCWVVALGTNDTANVAAGASYTRARAIDEMMKAVDPSGAERVLWVNVYTTKTSGHWSNANMQAWNQALIEAQGRWANLSVLDWAGVASSGVAPFSDGIHHTVEGYSVRNRAIAEALARVWPEE